MLFSASLYLDDYEMGSRGRRKERYPLWKERAHDSFWSQVDKPKPLNHDMRSQCEALEAAFMQRIRLHDTTTSPNGSGSDGGTKGSKRKAIRCFTPHSAYKKGVQLGSFHAETEDEEGVGDEEYEEDEEKYDDDDQDGSYRSTSGSRGKKYSADCSMVEGSRAGMPWEDEEVGKLAAGVKVWGTGKWHNLKMDARFGGLLTCRSNASLKEKWRSMRSDFTPAELTLLARKYGGKCTAAAAKGGRTTSSSHSRCKHVYARPEALSSSGRRKRAPKSHEAYYTGWETGPFTDFLDEDEVAVYEEENEEAEEEEEETVDEFGAEEDDEGGDVLYEPDSDDDIDGLIRFWSKRNNSLPQSNFHGVSWDRPSNKWRARVCHKNNTIALGYFSSAVAAARVYDAEVIRRDLQSSKPLNAKEFPNEMQRKKKKKKKQKTTTTTKKTMTPRSPPAKRETSEEGKPQAPKERYAKGAISKTSRYVGVGW